MKNKIITFWAIFILIIVSVGIIVKKPTKLGLDLVGGSRIMLEAQTTETIKKITPDMMDSLLFAIENRINALGVSETTVQKVGDKRLLIEIPNISDPAEAKKFIGEVAELEFKKPIGVDKLNNIIWVSTGLSGKDLKKSIVENSASGEWSVGSKNNWENHRCSHSFFVEEVSKRLSNLISNFIPIMVATHINSCDCIV